MKEERYFYVPDASHQNELPKEEALHALKVLRMQVGDEMFLMDGGGVFYQAMITTANSKHCLYSIQQALPQEKTWNGNIHLAIAPTKMMDRMEWMTEKCTEIGFDELTFLRCQFSERTTIRTDRIEKIVIGAVKQSRKPWKPVVNDLIKFSDFIQIPRKGRKFIAHCYEEISRKDLFLTLQQMPQQQDVTILIGPEGDFSIDEVKEAINYGYEPITLGSSRLRTETAGLMAVAMAQLSKRKDNA